MLESLNYILYIQGPHASWKVMKFKLGHEKSWNKISVMESREISLKSH